MSEKYIVMPIPHSINYLRNVNGKTEFYHPIWHAVLISFSNDPVYNEDTDEMIIIDGKIINSKSKISNLIYDENDSNIFSFEGNGFKYKLSDLRFRKDYYDNNVLYEKSEAELKFELFELE